jgi:hypothetical protein
MVVMTPPRGRGVLSLAGNQYLEAREPWVPEQGYLLTLDEDRLGELQGDLDHRSACSQSIPKIPIALRRRWMLCLISARRGHLTHVARSVVYYEAESGKDKLELWNLLPLVSPVRISAIKSKLEGRQAWRAKRALNGGPISASAFPLVLAALAKVDGNAFGIADSLIDHRPPSPDPAPTIAKTNWAYQRDAVVTSLEIARIPKDRLGVAPQLKAGEAGEITSIFDSDEAETTIEDLAILQDLDSADADWTFVKRQRYPAKTFVNGDTQLTIILANKLPLERQLGVDLVYVNETFKAAVFVQYKMFAGADGEDGYRPDDQLTEEIARMDAAAAKLAAVAQDETCDGYRFGAEAFFLKFCSKLLTYSDAGHVPGLYVPLGFWKRLAETPAVRGKRGGTIVYADTFSRRYFTPTHFIDMVGRGWVGTSALQTEVLVPYLKAAMAGKKGIVLAVQSSKAVAADESDDPPTSAGRKPPKSRHPGKKAPTIVV